MQFCNGGVEYGQPVFELLEALAVPARLALGDQWRGVLTEGIDIDVMAAITEAAGATQWVAFGMHADGLVQCDQFALASIALTLWPIGCGQNRVTASKEAQGK